MKILRNIILILALVIGVGLFLVLKYFNLPAQRFARMPKKTLDLFVQDCNQLIKTTPLSDKRYVEVNVDSVQFDPTVSRFEPRSIVLSRNRVWIMFKGGKVTGFSVTWTTNEANSAEWILSLFDGAQDRILLRKIYSDPSVL